MKTLYRVQLFEKRTLSMYLEASNADEARTNASKLLDAGHEQVMLCYQPADETIIEEVEEEKGAKTNPREYSSELGNAKENAEWLEQIEEDEKD